MNTDTSSLHRHMSSLHRHMSSLHSHVIITQTRVITQTHVIITLSLKFYYFWKWCGGRPEHCMQLKSSTCLKFFKPQTASGTSLQLVSLYQSLVIIFCLYVALLCLPLSTILQPAICLAKIPVCAHIVKKMWINVNGYSNIVLQYYSCVI